MVMNVDLHGVPSEDGRTVGPSLVAPSRPASGLRLRSDLDHLATGVDPRTMFDTKGFLHSRDVCAAPRSWSHGVELATSINDHWLIGGEPLLKRVPQLRG